MVNDSANQAMASQIKNLEEKTGRSFDEWIKIVKDSDLEKHGELVSMLKEKYGIGHGYANLVVHSARESHAGFSEEANLVNEQYKGKENLRPLYNKLMKEVNGLGKDVEVSPKKAYVSLRRKKQFAIIQPSTKTRIDLGLNLKDVAATGKLEASGSWNSMCSYRVKLEDEKAIDDEVIHWLKKAYEQAG